MGMSGKLWTSVVFHCEVLCYFPFSITLWSSFFEQNPLYDVEMAFKIHPLYYTDLSRASRITETAQWKNKMQLEFLLFSCFDAVSVSCLICLSIFFFHTEFVRPDLFQLRQPICLSLRNPRRRYEQLAAFTPSSQLNKWKVTKNILLLTFLGIQWSNSYSSPIAGDTASFGWLCWLMLIDSILYFIIGAYIRTVFPGKP